MAGWLAKIFGSRNDREMKRMMKIVSKMDHDFAEKFAKFKEADFPNRSEALRNKLATGCSHDDILPEAFALVREAATRVLGQRHFDVQLLGGMVLHAGKIAEMATGEGKTLTSTLPAYLHALTGKGVHMITVNNYLAKRDAEWMGPVFEFLGLKVGVVLPDMPTKERKAAYACDITYGTNNEFAFDYLRDNMVFAAEDRVQRKLYYAIIDEVDSILVDEARTPLIISGPVEASSTLYKKVNRAIKDLIVSTDAKSGDYTIDEKEKMVPLTEKGHESAEVVLQKVGLLQQDSSLYDLKNISLLHYLQACLRANHIYFKDVDYIVRGNEVVIIDEHTGRAMPGRRWSDGLHQALEAKEGVEVQKENQTLACITFQNYFRMYQLLSGMTGTADTEAEEFQQIYNLEVLIVPTHRPMVREDFDDVIYMTKEEKYAAILEDIRDRNAKGQPILVGTTSIETSEMLAAKLKKAKVKHQVLNAKMHEKEAYIIAQAGCLHAVTIATNMAGRGTDIVLGGNVEAQIAANPSYSDKKKAELRKQWQADHKKVKELGGLYVLGTERNESRRIDNQLRGRSGRQGDPGNSNFYLSLDDNLLRIFASDRIRAFMQNLKREEGMPIQARILTSGIENSQRRVEAFHFDIRKQLLRFDDVMNEQRKRVYAERLDVIEATTVHDLIKDMRIDVVESLLHRFLPQESIEDSWNLKAMEEVLQNEFAVKLEVENMLQSYEGSDPHALVQEKIVAIMEDDVASKIKAFGQDQYNNIEQGVLLQTLDWFWKEHLGALDHLRQGIHFRSYAQKNPAQEFKRESFEMFQLMLVEVRHEVIAKLNMLAIPQESVSYQGGYAMQDTKIRFDE
jgi:preprotein translocase subunit SecA